MDRNLTGLLFALRTQKKIDLTEERRQLFSTLLAENTLLRVLYNFAESLPPGLKRILIIFYAISVSASKTRPATNYILSLEKGANEINTLDEVTALLGSVRIVRLRFLTTPGSVLYSLFFFLSRPSLIKRIFVALSKIERSQPLYARLRQASTLLIYCFLVSRFKNRIPKALIFSTVSNPHGTAGMGYALNHNIPVIFSAHGGAVTTALKIYCDLALFHGPQILNDYVNAGSKISSYLFYPQKSMRVKNASEQSVCICLSKDFNMKSLADLILKLMADATIAKIFIRPHPHSLVSIQQLTPFLRPSKVLISKGTLEHDLSNASFAIAGNSSVHLDVLSLNTPCFFSHCLDLTNQPLLSFIEKGLVLKYDYSTSASDQLTKALELIQSRENQILFSHYVAHSDPLLFKNKLVERVIQLVGAK